MRKKKLCFTLEPCASKTLKVNISISLGLAKRSQLSGGPLLFLAAWLMEATTLVLRQVHLQG